ncbi:uncharacterized protein E0L32_001080 [Thyridium curvatum]|uniref:Uncharacterized protein n=1 Tax=Thyridium curvatum TaxID=1093900 RepID=A0A507AMZ8_9PEZI|nr:uncharacterized protein E0L32_001080 [Thyridium curvatum]TPX11262.1 hypothetical protein E0L32_001080 [Thyridium curvatum]
MMQTYGMTEAACWIAMNRITEHVALTELGPLVPGLEARLMNDDRTEAPVGGPGELWLRGLNMTKGYLDNEKANTEAFPEPKWLNTGDIVSISPQGILKLQGRTKELIKYSGFQVSPSELEQYIARHSAVADCAVTYTLDANSEELPTAYVVLVDDIKESPMKLAKLQEVHESVDSQVAGYKKLRGGVWEVSKIARNPTSKIVRRELRSYITGLMSKRDYARSSKI